jgi:hypothetical protein
MCDLVEIGDELIDIQQLQYKTEGRKILKKNAALNNNRVRLP